MIKELVEIKPGDARLVKLQSPLEGSGRPNAFGASDVLSAKLLPPGSSTPACTPAASWWTDGGVQTGYDEGQVAAQLTATQTAALMPSVTYELDIWRAIGGDAGNMERIASCRVLVRRPAPL